MIVAIPAPLTSRQQDVLDFIALRITVAGMAPTSREISRHFGWRSTNGVACHLAALERKGRVARETLEYRGIRLSDQAQAITSH